jgi:hypothetical protein
LLILHQKNCSPPVLSSKKKDRHLEDLTDNNNNNNNNKNNKGLLLNCSGTSPSMSTSDKTQRRQAPKFDQLCPTALLFFISLSF